MIDVDCRYEEVKASREQVSDFSVDSAVELKLDRHYNHMVVLNDKLKILDAMDKRDAKCKHIAQVIVNKLDNLRSEIDRVNAKRLTFDVPDII